MLASYTLVWYTQSLTVKKDMSHPVNQMIIDQIIDEVNIDVANGRIKPSDFEGECTRRYEERMNESIESEMDDDSGEEL